MSQVLRLTEPVDTTGKSMTPVEVMLRLGPPACLTVFWTWAIAVPTDAALVRAVMSKFWAWAGLTLPATCTAKMATIAKNTFFVRLSKFWVFMPASLVCTGAPMGFMPVI